MNGSDSHTWVMTMPFQSKTIFGNSPSGRPRVWRIPSTNPWFARNVIIA